MQQVLSFIKSRSFLAHILIVLLLIVSIVTFTYQWLDSYTNHGETVTVPDLRGMKYKELQNFLAQKSLSVKVSDSSVFMLDKPPGTVIEQDPAPRENVKENRTIYVTITRSVAPGVKVPNLVDVSQRQAEAILASFGLQSGKAIYKPDLAKDAVLAMMHNGQTITAGTELPKGSVIDLILGDGIGSTDVIVPRLIDFTLDEATFVLRGSQLNLGTVTFDLSVKDSSEAKIYKQVPEPGDSVIIKQGESIDIFLR